MLPLSDLLLPLSDLLFESRPKNIAMVTRHVSQWKSDTQPNRKNRHEEEKKPTSGLYDVTMDGGGGKNMRSERDINDHHQVFFTTSFLY